MQAAIIGLPRYIATPEVSNHRLLIWVPPNVGADKNLIVIARDDDATFGILHSRFHELWALRLGTALEDRPCYTPSTTFETLPFPPGLPPALPPDTPPPNPRARPSPAPRSGCRMWCWPPATPG